MYCTPNEVREMGTGTTTSAAVPLTDSLLRSIIERASRFFDLECGVPEEYFESAYYPVWQSNHVYVVGDIVTPSTRNSHKYRVTTAGTSGSTEPTFPTSSAGTVSSGTAPTAVVFTENGADVVASAQTFYSQGGTFLPLPPYVAGTLDTTIGLPDGYTAQTFIERGGFLVLTDERGIAYPYVSYGAWFPGWYIGVPMSITALWGYASTPADVKLAVIEWAINIWRETDPAGLKLTNLDGGVLREIAPPRVREIARRYRVKAAKAVFI